MSRMEKEFADVLAEEEKKLTGALDEEADSEDAELKKKESEDKELWDKMAEEEKTLTGEVDAEEEEPEQKKDEKDEVKDEEKELRKEMKAFFGDEEKQLGAKGAEVEKEEETGEEQEPMGKKK